MSIADDEKRARFEEHWGVEINPIAGDTQTRTFDKIENGAVKALYVVGENPLMADVHMNHTRKLLEKLDFLVVQDIFLTETAQLADVVFPAKSWGEVDGTYTNTDRRVQRVRKAVDAHPNIKEDWQILCELATQMGYPMSYESSEQIWDEVRELAWEVFGGISYARLEQHYSLHYPCSGRESSRNFTPSSAFP
ncbi:molybdopterin oxidoreductase family protein [Bacillus sp. T3]|uniref:molybdopterin oxidoreductase family protein n=1 Tax=Bacillus sp. T3 TaxID=467262 RepID=UPI0029823D6E|nr:molybdopterin-dependent oxidoreductase [Bacillus sp. T3]